MNDTPEPTLHLLSLLLGKRTAQRVYRGSLADLCLDDAVPENVKARLRASREHANLLLEGNRFSHGSTLVLCKRHASLDVIGT